MNAWVVWYTMLHDTAPDVPHYHAKEATRHLKRALGSAYRHDARHVVRAAWEVVTTCHFVDALDGVQYFCALDT